MRWIVMTVLAMVFAGLAVAEEQALPPFAAMVPGDVKAAVVVMDYQDPAPKPKFGGAEEGHKLVAVKIGVGNGEDGEVSVNPMFVEIQCADSAVRGTKFGSAPKPELRATQNKKASDKVVGWVAFEIPNDLKVVDCQLNYGMLDKSDWIPISAAMEKQPKKDAPK